MKIVSVRGTLVFILVILLAGCATPLLDIEKETKAQEKALLETKKYISSDPYPVGHIDLPARNLNLIVTATVTHPVTILGKEGFSPSEITIEPRDSITWANADPQKKDVVLTFEKQGATTAKFRTSPVISPGMEESMIFSEPGMYVYWTIGYGVKGKLRVTENE